MNQNKSINSFISNYIKHNKKIPLDNIYVFTVKDKDENIIDTRFGINVVCKAGFNDYIPLKYNYYLMIGDGSPTLSPNDTTMAHTLGIVNGESISNKFEPVYYDSDAGLIIERHNVAKYILDYTFLDSDFDITEFGVRSTNNENNGVLITHGIILDNEGRPSHITKRLYEKLEVSMFFLYAISPDVYDRMRYRGVYGVIPVAWTKYAMSKSITNRLYIEHTYLDRAEARVNTVDNFSKSALMKNTESFKTPSYLVEDSSAYVSEFVCGSYLHIPLRSDEETLVNDNIFCDDEVSASLNSMFQGISRQKYSSTNNTGLYRFPVVNFDIKSSYMYNLISHDWDIPDAFTDCKNSEFSTCWCSIRTEMYMENPNGLLMYENVYENINMDVPIKKFDNAGNTIYAADKWWDISTWIRITDLNNLTREQGTKRYYIQEKKTSQSNADLLVPTRDQNYPAFIWDKNYNISTTVFDDPSMIQRSPLCISDEYSLVCTQTYMVFYPEGMEGGWDTETSAVTKSMKFTYDSTITGSGTYTPTIDVNYRHVFDDKLVVCSGWYGNRSTSTTGTHIRLIDISDQQINMNASATNPFIDFQIDFTNKTYNNAGSISAKWDGDYWVGYETNAKEIVAVRIHGKVDNDVPEQMVISSNISSYTFDYGNNGLIYAKTSEPLLLYYYDLENETETVINIQDFDSNVNTIVGYIGYNGIVYIQGKDTSNITHVYFYHVSDESWNTDHSISCYGINVNGMMGYVDRCAVLGGSGSGSNQDYLYLLDANNPYQFTEWNVREYFSGIPTKIGMKYMNNGKQLVLAFNGNVSNASGITHVMDIGRALDDPSSFFVYKRTPVSVYGILYKDYFISRKNNCFNVRPIGNVLYHKMTLTTDTITAYNNPFRIPETDMFRIVYSGDMDRILNDPCSTYPIDCATKCNSISKISMYESSTLTHKFIPCKRNSDSCPGLYDTVAGEFLKVMDPGGCGVGSTSSGESLPSGYTQVSELNGGKEYGPDEEVILLGNPNWITTAQMQNPVYHTQNTKIEWEGIVQKPAIPHYSYDPPAYEACLFGSTNGTSDNKHQFYFRIKAINDDVLQCQYCRGSATVYTTSFSFVGGSLKVVCDGFTATIYSGSRELGSITVTDGTLDDGIIPMAFWTLGCPNGVDYTNHNS